MSRSSPQRSSIDAKSEAGLAGAPTVADGQESRGRLRSGLRSLTRWLHTYLSMLGLAVVLFFSVTGITVNHPEWFGADLQKTVEALGQLEAKWVQGEDSAARAEGSGASEQVQKLEVVEYLRSTHGIRGALASFTVNEGECAVTFKGPGYAADAFIDRQTGRYDLTQRYHGWIAVLNDLHKGRDAGDAWSILIDVSAGLMIVAAVTGMVLLFFLNRRRAAGVLVGLAGTVIAVLVFVVWVP